MNSTKQSYLKLLKIINNLEDEVLDHESKNINAIKINYLHARRLIALINRSHLSIDKHRINIMAVNFFCINKKHPKVNNIIMLDFLKLCNDEILADYELVTD